MQSCNILKFISSPDARATIEGRCIKGVADFYQTRKGLLVVTEVTGLPDCNKHKVFALHIHEGGSCSGNSNEPFAGTGSHYNPDGCEHPYHAGDLPPLFSNCGYAFSAVLTDRFSLCDIIGRTVVIHSGADDFTTQPAGNAGEKIACGIIRRCER